MILLHLLLPKVRKNPYNYCINSNLLSIYILKSYMLGRYGKASETNDSNISVNVPTIDCLLGDKLTAFAPNTTGIPYGINKELEIIKQLFDVSNLFNVSNDLKIVKNTFVEIAKNTLKYRHLENLSYIDVLDDIYTSSMVIVYNGGKNYKEKYNELLSGIRKFQSYVIGISFNPMVALSCATRASYLAMLIKNDIYSDYFHNKKIDIGVTTIFGEKIRTYYLKYGIC